jgi:cytochrome P450
LGSLFEVQRDPLQFLLSLTRKYGDVVRFRVGIYDGYLVNHPDYVQYVLQQNHQNYNKENYDYQMLKPVLGEGLVTSSGDHWLRQRRLIQPAFHRERITQFSGTVTAATQDLLEAWDRIAACNQPIDVASEMSRLTLRIIGKVLFSVDVCDKADTVGSAFITLNKDIARRLRTVFVPPLWVPTPRNLAFKRARAQLNRVVYDIISGRRQGSGQHHDLLQDLLTTQDEADGTGLTDRELRDQVMTLLLAGHETTATLLTWTWYLLSKHPGVARRLTAELDRVLGGRVPGTEALPALEYTEMVLEESLRLYPPIWIISRKAIAEDTIGAYRVPAGTVVVLSQYAMHRHPHYWENPAGFDPQRFTLHRSAERHRYAYFPFGGGPRLCIGADLAMMEAQLILATISQRYRLDLVPGHPVEPEPLITLRPRYGMPMTLHPNP